MAMMKRIGIMGGTFNPVHNGHLLLAEAAREQFDLDEIIFMPSGNSYMKDAQTILDSAHRAAMLALAIESNPYFGLSYLEIERKGPTYTFETISQLRQQNPDTQIYFLMGADSLFSLENWKNPVIILKNCIIVTAIRGNGTEQKVKEVAAHLSEKYGADVRLLRSRHIDISSSEIRERLLVGCSVRYMLPDAVLKYIKENHLYSLSEKGMVNK